MNPIPPQRTALLSLFLQFMLAALGAFQLYKLAVVAIGRISVPLDLLIWSESPFMTNMMKLDRGLPIFSDHPPITESNSFVYSPGLEFISYALLRPFGVHLEVEWSRLLSVLFALAAGVLGGVWIGALSPRIKVSRFEGVLFTFLVCVVALLIKFANPTAYTIHPDNLATLLFLGTALACWLSLSRESVGWGIGAIVISALIPWAKQTALLTPAGVVLCLLIGNAWKDREKLVFGSVAVASLVLSLGVLFGPENNRFWLMEVPFRHGMLYDKLDELLIEEFFQTPFRLLLYVLLPVALVLLWREKRREHRAFLLAWAAVGLTGCAPMISGYFKEMGQGNNLGILDFWAFLPLGVVIGSKVMALQGSKGESRSGNFVPISGFAGLAVLALILFAVVPHAVKGHQGWLKMPAPDPVMAYPGYLNNLSRMIRKDLDANRKVLVAHGASVLILNGIETPPRDRANSCLELRFAEIPPLGTIQRFREGYYDRIYLQMGWPLWRVWYGPDAHIMLNVHYTPVKFLPGLPGLDPPLDGADIFSPIEVLEPRTQLR